MVVKEDTTDSLCSYEYLENYQIQQQQNILRQLNYSVIQMFVQIN